MTQHPGDPYYEPSMSPYGRVRPSVGVTTRHPPIGVGRVKRRTTSLVANSNIPEKLFNFRTRRKLTYREVAKGTGLSISTVRDIEKNRQDPQWSTVRKLLKWMDETE